MTTLELAKQTFIQLSKEQRQPTPENYKLVYEKLAGIESVEKKALDEINWASLLSFLLKQLEVHHEQISFAEKKERLNRLISKAEHDSIELGRKLQSLITSWGEGKIVLSVKDDAHQAKKLAPNVSTKEDLISDQHNLHALSQSEFSDACKTLLLNVIKLSVLPQFANNSAVAARVEDLLQQVQTANSVDEMEVLRGHLKSILLRSEMELDTLHRMQVSLTDMFRLLVASMREVSIEDNWLQGQLTIIEDIISKPLDIDVLYNAESVLKVLIQQQSEIKPSMVAAKDTLKQMMKAFVSGIADVVNNAGDYTDKIDVYQQQITDTEDMVKLNSILQNLSSDIGSMSLDAKKSYQTFDATQKKVEEAERQINELTTKLDAISEAAHQDYLTGALNRRGMDEAIQREFDRADRHNTPISLAMIDIDHFKKINDTMGHTTGDVALAHLAKVMKSVIRPTDVLARYGGEEFVILLPGSLQDDAVKVVTVIQRNLTKNFFMFEDNRVLITFSAGVAERMAGEKIESVLPRADAALYIAKQTGRNRVVGAQTTLEHLDNE